MPANPKGHPEKVRDIVGIGFGPSNLALAIAIEEHNRRPGNRRKVSAVFLERQPRFGWHRGMLLDGATMQISFAKDLVTFRNPTSPYTFFSYLHDRGRLVDFVNHQTFFPTRHEFHDYLEWAAGRVDADIRYGTAATAVEAVRGEGNNATLRVRTADGSHLLGRNVVLALGLKEKLPDWATPSRRCFHNHQFLHRITNVPSHTHRRLLVVGAGQSAAEIVDYLHTHHPGSEVHNVFGRYGYSPADDSPYANRIFDPHAVEELYHAPAEARRHLLDLHKGTNYSVVDIELINKLYAQEYAERVSGRRRLFMRKASTVTGAREHADGIDVDITSALTGGTETTTFDAVVLGTGFTAASPRALLGDLLAPADTAGGGISYRYRASTAPGVHAGVYLNGGVEQSHGLTSSLLSNLALRSGEILGDILDTTPAQAAHPLGSVHTLARQPA